MLAPTEMAQALAVGTGRLDRVVMAPSYEAPANAEERSGTLANAIGPTAGSSGAFDSRAHRRPRQRRSGPPFVADAHTI